MLPERVIIKYISTLNKEEVACIDTNFNKAVIRIPLLLYPWASGLLSSLTTAYIKGVSELVNSKELIENLQ